MNHSYLLGLGTALPPHSIQQGDAAELALSRCCDSPQQHRLLAALYRRTHVDRRASVLLHEEAGSLESRQGFFPPAANLQDQGPGTMARMDRYALEAPILALEAAGRALSVAKVDPSRISQLITVSCTGFVAPGLDLALIEGMNLPSTLGRTHIGFMGCHAALNGLRVASALALADPSAHVLVVAVELCSLHFRYGWNPQTIVANALFADGAAACVVAAAPSPPTVDAWRVAASGSCVFPNSRQAMSWRIDDHGFVMTLSPQVPDLIASHLRPWVEKWLADQGMKLDEVRSWAIHPGGPRIVSEVAQTLDLTQAHVAPSYQVLAQCGNMSSPTVLFILKQLQNAHAPRPCVAMGFGPGLAVEAALLT